MICPCDFMVFLPNFKIYATKRLNQIYIYISDSPEHSHRLAPPIVIKPPPPPTSTFSCSANPSALPNGPQLRMAEEQVVDEQRHDYLIQYVQNQASEALEIADSSSQFQLMPTSRKALGLILYSSSQCLRRTCVCGGGGGPKILLLYFFQALRKMCLQP